jgi:hypothetical protein
MASWEKGGGFRLCGVIYRAPFVAPSGKFARLNVAAPGGRGGEMKHVVRAFDGAVIEEIRGLGIGMTVQVTGSVDNEALKNKAGEDVKVDGYTAWVSKLTARKIEVEGSSKPAARPDVKDPETVRKAW